MHALDGNLEGSFRVGAPCEDGVDRLDRFALLAGEPRHHGLRQQLPAEDDAVRGAEAVRPVAIGADLFDFHTSTKAAMVNIGSRFSSGVGGPTALTSQARWAAGSRHPHSRF